MNTLNGKPMEKQIISGFSRVKAAQCLVITGFLVSLTACLPAAMNSKAADQAEGAEQAPNESGGGLVEGLVGMFLSETQRLGKVKKIDIAEKRGNSVVLTVSYDDIKLPTDVHLTAEVMRHGQRLDGFYSTVADVNSRKGKDTITITWNNTQQGIEQESDQVKIILFRGDNPNNVMNAKRFQLAKIWTTSTQLDQDKTAAPPPKVTTTRPAITTIPSRVITTPSTVTPTAPSKSTAESDKPISLQPAIRFPLPTR